MSYNKCPVCTKDIPEYRNDDPYCDCGWQLSTTSKDYDEFGIVTILFVTILACFVQIFILSAIHFSGSFLISILSNMLFSFFDGDTVLLIHYLFISVLDFVALAILYFCLIYFVIRKNSHPILMACIFGCVVVGFKFLVIDPRSNILYPFIGYSMNILLLAISIFSGVYANHVRKKLNRG